MLKLRSQGLRGGTLPLFYSCLRPLSGPGGVSTPRIITGQIEKTAERCFVARILHACRVVDDGLFVFVAVKTTLCGN